jgi:hypothetical protein
MTMNDGWLTVKFVEALHHAVRNRRDVAPAMAALRNATLPGLMEYGCLRRALPAESLPDLPKAVLDSPVGKSLRLVRSDLGLRTAGKARPALKRVDPQPVEFWAIEGEEGFADQSWDVFEIRFNRSARNVGFTPSVADGVQGALHEMAENAIIHSESPTGILVGYQVTPEAALFTVVDVGIGILASLRTHSAYQHLQVHLEAIRAALHVGVSRFGPDEGGFGFSQVFKSLAADSGLLRFRSGEGCITMDGTDLGADTKGNETFPPGLPGFQVTVCCRRGAKEPKEPLV